MWSAAALVMALANAGEPDRGRTVLDQVARVRP